MVVTFTKQEVPSAVAAAPTPVSFLSEPLDWLVLSADQSTRDLVLGVVLRNGHNGQAESASSSPAIAVAASRYRCTFIDLVYPGGRMADLDRWTSLLRLHSSRLVVRGGDDNLADERWARNAGAAIYLPGQLAKGCLERLLDGLCS
jgi:hypothetical protein